MKFLQGITDFERIIRENIFYVDKTPYIAKLEDDSPYLMFIRPRRFGKSLFVNMLSRYYDVDTKGKFQELFGKLYIGAHPTSERNSYLILYFNFSMVDTSGTVEQLEKSFQEHCAGQFQWFMSKYSLFFPEEAAAEVNKTGNAAAKLAVLSRLAAERSLPIYVIIDEYDNFANNVLAGAEGESKYRQLTHGTGFFRTFFTFLKGATGNEGTGAIRRIFMAGVSPLVLDDVTSGFNIARNISCLAEYNGMLGFSEGDVRAALEYIQANGRMSGTVEEHLSVMREYYDNYCFASRVDGNRMFNTNMCIAYLDALSREGHAPDALIDTNTRTDYNKLKHLIVLNKRLNGNFNVLCNLAIDGQVEAQLEERFPLDELKHRDQFISLLFYMGILTIDGTRFGLSQFRIPNRTVQTILFSYIQNGLRQVGAACYEIAPLRDAFIAMAYEGEWRPVLDYIHDKLVASTAVRDYVEGEKCVQIAHLVAMWPMTCYLPRTEHEAKKGYLDLMLLPNRFNGSDVPYTYILEFKYLKADATDSEMQKAIADATAQLQRYSSDEAIQSECAGTTLTTLAVVYKKWDIAYCEAVSVEELTAFPLKKA